MFPTDRHRCSFWEGGCLVYQIQQPYTSDTLFSSDMHQHVLTLTQRPCLCNIWVWPLGQVAPPPSDLAGSAVLNSLSQLVNPHT